MAVGQAEGSRSQTRWLWRALAAGLLLIAAAELVLRIQYREQLKIGAYPLVYELDPHLGYGYRPGAVSWISVPSISKEVRINANGFHGPEFERAKGEGVFRVAVVGSSNETGIWMDGDRPYTQILQELYRRDGRRIEVLNFAVDGQYRDLANLRLIEAHALEYDPDLVLLHVALRILDDVLYRESYRGYVYEPGHSGHSEEDVQRVRRQAQRYLDRLESRALLPLYDASYVVRAVHRRFFTPEVDFIIDFNERSLGRDLEIYRRKRLEIGHVRKQISQDESLSLVVQTQAAVERAGARLYVFLYDANPEVQEEFARYGLPCLALDLPLDRSLVHEHDGHYNQEGHEVIARRFLELLEGIVPER